MDSSLAVEIAARDTITSSTVLTFEIYRRWFLRVTVKRNTVFFKNFSTTLNVASGAAN